MDGKVVLGLCPHHLLPLEVAHHLLLEAAAKTVNNSSLRLVGVVLGAGEEHRLHPLPLLVGQGRGRRGDTT